MCNFPGCKSLAPAGNSYCFLHGRHFNSVTIKPVDKNEKRAEQEKEYLVNKKAFLLKNQICQVKGCTKKAVDVHHKKGRLGTLIYNILFFLGCCRQHHKQIEQNPRWAKQEGYSISRLAK